MTSPATPTGRPSSTWTSWSIGASTVDFTASQTVVTPGQTVTFTDASTPGGTAYAWDFGDGGTANGPDRRPCLRDHDRQPVHGEAEGDLPEPARRRHDVQAGLVTVDVGLCTVPSLDGVKFNGAAGGLRYSPQLHGTRHPRRSGPRTATSSSRPVPDGRRSDRPCTSNITVTGP